MFSEFFRQLPFFEFFFPFSTLGADDFRFFFLFFKTNLFCFLVNRLGSSFIYTVGVAIQPLNTFLQQFELVMVLQQPFFPLSLIHFPVFLKHYQFFCALVAVEQICEFLPPVRFKQLPPHWLEDPLLHEIGFVPFPLVVLAAFAYTCEALFFCFYHRLVKGICAYFFD